MSNRSPSGPSPRRIALFVALAIGLFAGAFALALPVPGGRMGLLWAGLLALAVFGVSLLVVSQGIQRFIYSRIKLIYRTVHELKTHRNDEMNVDMGADVLGQVNTEVVDWAKARRTEIKELKEREQYRREFIGNVAHELKTPIFNIQGYILTLLEGGLEDDKVNRDFLNRASKGVDRLIKIVEELDMISRLESGVLDMSMRRMDLADLVQEVFENMEMTARDKGITLRTTLDAPLWVVADRDRMAQVFTNLLINAVNYGREGGYAEVRTFELDDRVMVELADDGIGISGEHLPRLFERFYRVGKSRSRHEGGSGLGLAIVKHIIDAHGESITVKSVEGKGTTFGFTLRLAR